MDAHCIWSTLYPDIKWSKGEMIIGNDSISDVQYIYAMHSFVAKDPCLHWPKRRPLCPRCPRCNKEYNDICSSCGYPALLNIDDEPCHCTDYRVIKMGPYKGKLECSDCYRVYVTNDKLLAMQFERICNGPDKQRHDEAQYTNYWSHCDAPAGDLAILAFVFSDHIEAATATKTKWFNRMERKW